jgi:hypothetical protein
LIFGGESRGCFFAILHLPLDDPHGPRNAGVEFLLQFVLGPQGERTLDPTLVDVLRHEPDDRFEQPRAGRAARLRVVVLLDEHRREPARATEVFDDAFNDLGAVRDVRPALLELRQPDVDAGRFNLGECRLAPGTGPEAFLFFLVSATRAAGRRELPVADPEMLDREREREAAALARAALGRRGAREARFIR